MMNIVNNKTIIVPKGIRYISQWSDYNLNDFQFPHILDKKIPGCGYTEYCITSPMNIILCSPRRILLANKEQQHPDEVLYFRNDLDLEAGVDKDITKSSKISVNSLLSKSEDENASEILKNLEDSLRDYVMRCQFNNIPCKILVTYDSFYLVKEFLIRLHVFDSFYTVIDEFQSIFTDSRFKSSTELDFVCQLRDIRKVCFVSATPMIEDYLKDLDDFKDLPYFELDWVTEDPLRVARPDLDPKITQSIVREACLVIDEYREGKSEVFRYKNDLGKIQEIQSKEAVLYVNSVNNILSIIKKSELRPEDCNILCSDTNENRKKIKNRLGKKFTIGKVPLKGEPHKMFTFCTRTVYLGADFYSTNAKTYIFSDANVDSLSVDITLDLPQILGRQRLIENPWKNRATLFYKTLRGGKKMTKKDFDDEVKEKVRQTESLLLSYSTSPTSESKNDLARTYLYVAANANYRENYVAVNQRSGATLIPCLNVLVRVAEQRAFDIQQMDYKDRFSVFNTLNSVISQESGNNIVEFLKYFDDLPGDTATRLKAICECPLTEPERSVVLDQVDIRFRNFYYALGPDRCKATGYNITRMNKELQNTTLVESTEDKLKYELCKEFKIGYRYTKSEIKEKLGNVYRKLNYTQTPKASDLENYFEIKSCLIANKETGKRDSAFEIISLKKLI